MLTVVAFLRGQPNELKDALVEKLQSLTPRIRQTNAKSVRSLLLSLSQVHAKLSPSFVRMLHEKVRGRE